LADDHLKRAIAADPTFVPAYFQLADLYRGRGEEARAEQLLRQALERNPDSALAHYGLGLSLDPATQSSTRRSTNCAAPRPGTGGGAIRLRLRRRARARHDGGPKPCGTLDAVLRRHPYDVSALEAGASWAAQRGETQTALGYLMTLRALRPGNRAIEQQIDLLRQQPLRR
jgi:tetratricopeptide (TPR) repeat protein